MNYVNLQEKFDEMTSSLFSVFAESSDYVFMYIFYMLAFSGISSVLFMFVGHILERFGADFEKSYKIIIPTAIIIALALGGFIAKQMIITDKMVAQNIVKDYAIQNIESKYNSDLLTDLELSSKEQKDGSRKFYIDTEYVNDEENINAKMKISFAENGEPSIMKTELVTEDLIKTLEK